MKESAANPDRPGPTADPRRTALNALADLTVEEFGQVLHRIVRDDNSIPLIRELVTATTTAVSKINGLAHQTMNGHSAAIVTEFGELLARTHAATVVITAEALTRGEIAASQKPNTTAWVRDHNRYLRTSGAAATGKAAALLQRPDLHRVTDRLITSTIPPAVAVAIATEYDKLDSSLDEHYRTRMTQPAIPDTTTDHTHGTQPGTGPDLSVDDPGDVVRPGPGWLVRDVILEYFCRAGHNAGTRGVKNIRDHLLVQYGTADAFQDDHETKRKYLELSAGRLAGGIWHYDLTLDPESRTEVEAAINQLSKPFPQNPETGEIDLRSAAQRRGQALVEVCRRGVTAARDIPTSPKSFLHVMVGLDDLVERTGSGTAIGTVADGTQLPIDTIRKIACNAGIIPTIMGSDSTVLDLGQAVRYFTPTQARALWIRDRHCTFPGCTIPATWCENHHLIHAADGGGSDLCNGALLCGRHHTIVHRDKLAGRVVDGKVAWDLRPGSYTELLTEHRAKQAGSNDPGFNANTVSSSRRDATESPAEGPTDKTLDATSRSDQGFNVNTVRESGPDASPADTTQDATSGEDVTGRNVIHGESGSAAGSTLGDEIIGAVDRTAVTADTDLGSSDTNAATSDTGPDTDMRADPHTNGGAEAKPATTAKTETTTAPDARAGTEVPPDNDIATGNADKSVIATDKSTPTDQSAIPTDKSSVDTDNPSIPAAASRRRPTAPRSGPERRPAGRSRPLSDPRQQRRRTTKPATAQDQRPDQGPISRT